MSPPPGRVCPLAREGRSLTWKPGAPAGPCSPLSPAGPWGRGDECGGAQGAPEPALRWPRVAVGGRGLADTHGWAGGTLGSSFTVFASGTLQGGTRAGTQRQPHPALPRAGLQHLPRDRDTAALSPRCCPRPSPAQGSCRGGTHHSAGGAGGSSLTGFAGLALETAERVRPERDCDIDGTVTLTPTGR